MTEFNAQDGIWTWIARVAANVTTYSNAGLAAKTGYDYRLRAIDASQEVTQYSAWSNVASATTPASSAP